MAEREAKVIVRLTVEKKEEFQQLAEELGITMSALGAYVIGNFIRTQKKVLDPLVSEMGEVAKQAVERVAAEAKAEAEEWSS